MEIDQMNQTKFMVVMVSNVSTSLSTSLRPGLATNQPLASSATTSCSRWWDKHMYSELAQGKLYNAGPNIFRCYLLHWRPVYPTGPFISLTREHLMFKNPTCFVNVRCNRWGFLHLIINLNACILMIMICFLKIWNWIIVRISDKKTTGWTASSQHAHDGYKLRQKGKRRAADSRSLSADWRGSGWHSGVEGFGKGASAYLRDRTGQQKPSLAAFRIFQNGSSQTNSKGWAVLLLPGSWWSGQHEPDFESAGWWQKPTRQAIRVQAMCTVQGRQGAWQGLSQDATGSRGRVQRV